jgi:proteasome lid subunit RPN8/RPN11
LVVVEVVRTPACYFALLIAHNHPSGDPDPSGEDVALTRRLASAGAILGIVVRAVDDYAKYLGGSTDWTYVNHPGPRHRA